jgi:hypothetical protein
VYGRGGLVRNPWAPLPNGTYGTYETYASAPIGPMSPIGPIRSRSSRLLDGTGSSIHRALLLAPGFWLLAPILRAPGALARSPYQFLALVVRDNQRDLTLRRMGSIMITNF